jgi:hypothetical protein
LIEEKKEKERRRKLRVNSVSEEWCEAVLSSTGSGDRGEVVLGEAIRVSEELSLAKQIL